MRFFAILLLASAACSWGGQKDAGSRHSTAAVPADLCFAMEGLSQDDRDAAEALLLKMLDSEALYTLAGGIKPISSTFVSFTVDAEAGSLALVDRARRLLGQIRCGDLVLATVYPFRRIYASEKTGRKYRHFHGAVIATEPLRRLLEKYSSEFAGLGVSPHSHPLEVLMAVEHGDELPRWRGYGRLFGFPADAVDFFVRAGGHQLLTGEFVQRRFISLPTYARPDRGVVYAVARDAEDSAEDRELRRRIEAVLASYRERRARNIGPGKPGAARLLREWYCPDGRTCALPPAPVDQATSGKTNEVGSSNIQETASAAR